MKVSMKKFVAVMAVTHIPAVYVGAQAAKKIGSTLSELVVAAGHEVVPTKVKVICVIASAAVGAVIMTGAGVAAMSIFKATDDGEETASEEASK